MNARYNLTNDILFRSVFGAESNKNLLLSLVNAVLTSKNLPELLEIKSVNPNLDIDFLDQKKPLMDIKAIDNSGRLYDIEMQIKKEPNYIDRSIYYLIRLYTGQAKEGDSYAKASHCIGIHFLDFVLFPEAPTYHNIGSFRLESESDKALSQALTLHFIEMPKLDLKKLATTQKSLQNLEKWVYFIKRCNDKEDAMIKRLITEVPEMNLSSEELDRLVEWHRERWDSEMEILLKADEYFSKQAIYLEGLADGESQGEARGEAKGKAEGIEQARLELAQKLKAEGFPNEKILELTGVFLE